MDFHSLSRKNLQALCKKNKIPANITSVAMANALQALQHVEGLEDVLNQFPEDAVIGSPDVPRTCCRTSTRRRPFKAEPESSQPALTRSRRGTRRGVVEEEAVDFERNEIPNTPAALSARRRAPSISAHSKLEAPKDESSVQQRVYSTRRSVRLLEKTMEKLTLKEEDRNIQPLKMDELCDEIANGSSQNEAKRQTFSEEYSGKTEDSEITSSESNSNGSVEIQIGLENDGQENSESGVHEAEDFNSKSELVDEAPEESSGDLPVNLVETPDEEIDVTDETIDENELGDLLLTKNSFGSQESHKDLNADQDLVTDSLAAENFNDVSTEAEASVRKEESGEPVPLNLSSSSVQTENLESESKRVVIVNVDVVDHDQGIRGSKVELSTEIEELYPKEESGDDCSEEESEDSEASDEEDYSSPNSENISDDEVKSEENDSDASLVDVDVIEAKLVITTQAPPASVKQETALSEVQFSTSEKLSSSSRALVDVYVSAAEDVTEAKSGNLPSGGNVSTKRPLPLFAADQLQGQFPRPTMSTPSQSSSKTRPIIQKISKNLGENQQDMQEAGGTALPTAEDEVKRNENATDYHDKTKPYAEKSLRQLQKMLKDKLQIKNSNKDNKDKIDTKAEKTRIALQTLPENRIAVDETQREN
ncbi:hypothetical protein PanWU01x14_308050 [Parasponia andersonii]|uniref:Uncharacterized protein n=1 Tax=Parasponia andersonii TaxID=3476 RepID=A0A2P5AR11_PARAD|nr:hypothetical protein PanWU01x14_308050 [Parasponia andersonii]